MHHFNILLLSAFFRCFPLVLWDPSLFLLICCSRCTYPGRVPCQEGVGRENTITVSLSVPCLFTLSILSFYECFFILMASNFSCLVVFISYFKIFCLPKIIEIFSCCFLLKAYCFSVHNQAMGHHNLGGGEWYEIFFISIDFN